jgi:hypothetical protein
VHEPSKASGSFLKKRTKKLSNKSLFASLSSEKEDIPFARPGAARDGLNCPRGGFSLVATALE